MDQIIPTLQNWLLGHGLSEDYARSGAALSGVLVLLALASIVNWLVKVIILGAVRVIVKRTATLWDDAFLKEGVFTRLSHLAPVFVFQMLGPDVLGETPAMMALVNGAVNIYLVVIVLMVLDALLNALHAMAISSGYAARVPVKGFFQAMKLVFILIGIVFILSTLLGKTPLYLLTGMGALTAVLLLVFKDAILGFVAGIMISVNELVRVGDWIEMAKAGADGSVIDVSLTTVKVQNWDKTITTIPSYDLISGSFKNWRGMFESGGRRIKRALHIDMQTVRFADEAMLARWRQIALLAPYLEGKQKEIETFNQANGTDLTVLGNGRRLTNLGSFRNYCAAYLRSNPRIHQEMTFLVRQLAPTEHGIPLELYVFTNDTRWAMYEEIQSDIFDHLLAVIGEFGLVVYQQPSGHDVRKITDQAQPASALKAALVHD